MKNNQDNIKNLFLPTGCLTEDSIRLYLDKSISKEGNKAIEEHLSGCELCATAIEGYRMMLEEKSADEIPLILADIRSQISGRAIHKQRKSYLRPILAVAALLIIVFASLIIFQTMFREKEPVLATLSVPDTKSDSAASENPEHLKPELKPQVQSDGQAVKSVFNQVRQHEKSQVSPSHDNQPFVEHVANEDMKDVEGTLNEAPPAEKKEMEAMGAAATGSGKSLAIIQPSNTIDANFTSPNETIMNDSFYLTPNRAYQVNASAPQTQNIGQVNTKAKKNLEQKEISYTIEEVVPSFPGGPDSLSRFIKKHLKYPEKAMNSKIQGTVNVSFYVEKDGSLSDIKIKKGLGYGCNEEALRLIGIMPKWIPGSRNGETVRAMATVPVKFRLK